jgi:uncharacterized protein (DUF305 family)
VTARSGTDGATSTREPAHEQPAATVAPDSAGTPRWARTVIALGAVLALMLLAATGGLLLGRSGSLQVPPADSVDVGFAQDMSVHHENAVQMAAWARDNTTDPAVRQLAYDIEAGQTAQIGQMQGWLTLWGAALQPVGGYMSWMTPGMGAETGMDHAAGAVARMPGVASTEDLARLRASTGPPADVLFLQLMLRHHEGATQMLRYAAERAVRPEVGNLAGQMLTAQTSEGRLIREMLTERGGAPLPP